MFVLYANKTQLMVRQYEPVTSGSVNVYRVRFEFSPEWNSMTRKAVFIGGGTQVSVALDETGECDIPWEVLTKHGGHLLVGVYGTTGDATLPTTRVSLGKILQGVTVDSDPSKPEESGPEVVLRVEPYTGGAEVTAIVSGVEYDAKNMSVSGENVPDGTLILRKVEE